MKCVPDEEMIPKCDLKIITEPIIHHIDKKIVDSHRNQSKNLLLDF